MHRASLIASLVAFAFFVYAQVRGVDPLAFFDGESPVRASQKGGSYHK